MLDAIANHFTHHATAVLPLEYEFNHDPAGAYLAEFSMGHEALGYWLTHELGSRQTLIRAIFTAVEALQNKQRWDYQLEGAEYNLLLNREEATVRAHALDADVDDTELEAGLNYYDDESFASCGLEDFVDILKAWQQFVADKP